MAAMSAKHSELPADSGASQPAGAGKPTDSLMQAIRTLGRLPKETRTATQDERQLARKLRWARRDGKVSGEEEAELAAMSGNHSALAAISAIHSELPADSGASQPAGAGKPNGSAIHAIAGGGSV